MIVFLCILGYIVIGIICILLALWHDINISKDYTAYDPEGFSTGPMYFIFGFLFWPLGLVINLLVILGDICSKIYTKIVNKMLLNRVNKLQKLEEKENGKGNI